MYMCVKDEEKSGDVVLNIFFEAFNLIFLLRESLARWWWHNKQFRIFLFFSPASSLSLSFLQALSPSIRIHLVTKAEKEQLTRYGIYLFPAFFSVGGHHLSLSGGSFSSFSLSVFSLALVSRREKGQTNLWIYFSVSANCRLVALTQRDV